jgi:hypothetical protein
VFLFHLSKNHTRIYYSFSLFYSSSSYHARAAHEFTRDWERYCVDWPSKYRYLQLIAWKKLSAIFGSSLSMDAFGEIITSLAVSLDKGDDKTGSCWTAAQFQHSFGLLKGLCEVPRFGLALSFMSETETKFATTLFDRLAQHVKEHPLAAEEKKEQAAAKAKAASDASTKAPKKKAKKAKKKKKQQAASSSYPMMIPGWSDVSDLTTRGAQPSDDSVTISTSSSSDLVIMNRLPAVVQTKAKFKKPSKKSKKLSKIAALPFTVAGVAALRAQYPGI